MGFRRVMPARSVRRSGSSTAPPMRRHGRGSSRRAPATRWAVSGGAANTSGRSGRYDLARRLLEVSELHGEFVLSSGRTSSVYFDKFRFLSDPELLREVAARVRALLPEGVTHLAAPEGAATLLLAAVALETGLPM